MLTLKDKLSRLSYIQACRLLGPEGKRLIGIGGKYVIDPSEQVRLDAERFSLTLPEATVEIALSPEHLQRLDLRCSACGGACEHQGAALALILEEKLTLGLSAPPPERVPVESLGESALVEHAIAERRDRAREEKMHLTPVSPGVLWSDYLITNPASGKSYRVALRGWLPGESYCSCPDFRKNTLGVCKHIFFTQEKVKALFKAAERKAPARITEIGLYLKYGSEVELRLLIPEDLADGFLRLLAPLRDRPIEDLRGLLDIIRQVEALGRSVNIYPDAEEFVQQRLLRERSAAIAAEIRKDPQGHPLRKALLKTELLPYQLDGIAFAVGAGRAILADDMGLGKTIQGIGVAELLARQVEIGKVLVICPASLKSQWRIEIERFSGRGVQLVLGSNPERAMQYAKPSFFTVCNYEQVLRDILSIERVTWDLIILDEGQRIKNWEAKTSRVIKSLRSRFALVLTGTPLENKLDDLYSVVEFIDDRRLGPAFRFYNQHRVVDEKGRLLGYKNLDELREKLKPVLLRRTRRMVLRELPPRTTEVRRVPPTDEQIELHHAHRRTIQLILQKRFLTEMDLLRLQKALLMCRMCANSTFLVDKQPPGYSSKLEELGQIFDQLQSEPDRKTVLFSEWTTMLDMIEPLLEARRLGYVRLDGSVPQKQRQGLLHQFRNDPQCRLFITTNAGATGLNLQAANTVINVDLPWNPAILEQRISRAHRMGQKNPVQVFLLVTEQTLEESLLSTLSAKHELALAVLDPAADTTRVDLSCGMEALKHRLEVLLGAVPDAPQDESMKAAVSAEAAAIARKESIAAAGGNLVGAAFAFIGEMFPEAAPTQEFENLVGAFRGKLEGCMEKDDQGRMKMTIALPDEAFLDRMAHALARMVGAGRGSYRD